MADAGHESDTGPGLAARGRPRRGRGIRENGDLIPSSSIGNNKVWPDDADKVILEVNSWQSEKLEGIHDVYQGFALPPHRKPIPPVSSSDRIGTPHLLDEAFAWHLRLARTGSMRES